MFKLKSILIKKVNIHTIKLKLLTWLLTIFFLFTVILVIDNIVATRVILSKTEDSIITSIEQTNRYLLFFFKKARDIVLTSAMYSKNISELASMEYVDNSTSAQKYNLLEDLRLEYAAYSDLDANIYSLYVYFGSINQMLTSKGNYFTQEEFNDSEWGKLAENLKVPWEWAVGYCDNMGFQDDNILTDYGNSKTTVPQNMISIICRADLLNKELATNTYISANFEENSIYNSIKVNRITDGSLIYLLDSANNIISAENKEQLGSSIDLVIEARNSNAVFKENSLFSVKVKGKPGYYMAMYQKLDTLNWGTLLLIPERELLAEQLMVWKIVVVFIAGMLAVMLLLALKFIVNYIDRPVAKLVKFMEEAEKGNFSKEIKEKRKDEFGYLYRSYNEMVRKIKQLIKDLYQEKLLKNEAELKMLQSQINPHFLYNTLDIINWIARANNVDKISRITIALSNIYRTTFNKGRDLIKVSEMIYTINSYIYIQKLRYGGSFDYNMEIDEKASEYQVLNLILQPIVENAIIHGLGENTGNLLKISTKYESGLIRFVVEDNGKGMSEEKLKMIMASCEQQGGTCDSGILNVYRRIKMYYGEEYGFVISSRINKGTSITITIPATEQAEGQDEAED